MLLFVCLTFFCVSQRSLKIVLHLICWRFGTYGLSAADIGYKSSTVDAGVGCVGINWPSKMQRVNTENARKDLEASGTGTYLAAVQFKKNEKISKNGPNNKKFSKKF